MSRINMAEYLVFMGKGYTGARLLGLLAAWLIMMINVSPATSQTQGPITGHYPPGQSGIRGASTPEAGIAYTNFNRFFTNLKVKDATGNTVEDVHELRYANISMIAWTTDFEIFGMKYGAAAGIPFSTGNLNPSSGDLNTSSLGLGDILITPLALYGRSTDFDYQVQFTAWTPSGTFSPGAANNRGSGFWELVYSLGGVYYPGGNREAWSVSALARIEQNFEQSGSGIKPGNDIVVDWGVGRAVRLWDRRIDFGVSGFAAWQVTSQVGGSVDTDTNRYRYFGAGPEVISMLTKKLTLRLCAQWEFAARNVVEGNNLWIVFNYRF
jgi:hypothetical protein